MLEVGVNSQCHTLATLALGKNPSTQCWGLGGPHNRSGQVWKIWPPTSIWQLDHPACSESLYRLHYPCPLTKL